MPVPVIPPAVDPENETLASALNNFILNFYGAIAKTVVDGAVVWVLPCDLSEGIPGYPRDPSLGTACYFKSIFETFGSQITDAEAVALAAEAAALNATALAEAAQLAAEGAQTTADSALALIAALGTMSAQNSDDVNITGGAIANASVTGLPLPTGASDAVTKGYADSLSGGITPKTGVRVATTANIASLSAVTVVDGVTLANLDRVLVKDQSAPAQNGIYSYTLATTTLARATDADTAGELLLNQYYFVSAGTINAGTGWFISQAPTVLGTDPIQFAQFSAASTYTAGSGLLLTGSQFSLDPAIAMLRANNLSDVANAAIARTNLGLGTANTPTFAGQTLTSSNVGSTSLTLANSSVGGHVYQLYTLGSGTGAPGSFGLGDSTTGLSPIVVSSSGRTTLLSLEATPIGGVTPSTGTFTTLTVNNTITSNGLTVTGNATTSGGNVASTFTRTGTSTNPSVWGVVSDSTTYNALTFNNVSSKAGMIGVSGGGGSDAYLYLRAPTSGGFSFRVNDAEIAAMAPNQFQVLSDFTASGEILTTSSEGIKSYNGSIYNVLQTNATHGVFGTITNHPLRFNVGGTAKAYITSTGLSVEGGIQETGVFNVRNYGALGNGSNNDTTAIANAVAAAKTFHGTVYFPAGTYMTDLITLTGATGIAFVGDGMGVSVVKARSPSQVLNVSSSNHVVVRGLTFDGSCVTRTAGQQAVVFDASQSSFTHNEIINSGEYAFFAGSSSTQISDLIVSNNLVRSCFADGINFQYVTKSVIANNVVDGSDDDCIALGYNGTGATSNVLVIGNFCRARNDLGTVWGRGILAERVNDCRIEGNYITGIKQTGIFLNNAGGTRVTRVTVANNTVYAVAVSSGHGIAAYGTTNCDLTNNTVINPVQGNCIEIADWNGLLIQGGRVEQSLDQFCRGIHADEGTGWAANWTDIRIMGVNIHMSGASTAESLYLNPHSSVSLTRTLVIGNVSEQGSASANYIVYGRMSSIVKIGNNVSQEGRAIAWTGTGVAATTFNNN